MEYVEVGEFLKRAKKLSIVDVRAPQEYQSGHIPHAQSIPLLNDDERAAVGTLYKQYGKQSAIEKGLEIVGPKMKQLALRAMQMAPEKQLLVYCWRGGMRSEKMAWLFELMGIQCTVLKGGFKAYRQAALHFFEQLDQLIILSGPTGSGKTAILHELGKLGEQYIDLEAIANHKGSAFGGIGQEDQPNSIQFQNLLYDAFLKLDLKKRIWLEGESMTIGRVYLPETLWKRMNASYIIKLKVAREIRARRLAEEYGDCDKEELSLAIRRIKDRLGGLRTKQAIERLEEGKLVESSDILLAYYDKSYEHSFLKYKKKALKEIQCSTGDPLTNAKLLLASIPSTIPLTGNK